MKTIPKIIHQIWIGDQSKAPYSYMNTWKMKGWEYKLWTEKEIDALNLENRKLYDYYISRQIWHGASDVARVEILERFGGIYIDADTERLENIDEAPFMNSSFFSVEANRARGVKIGQQRIANGIIGSVAGHPIIKNYREAMSKAKILTPAWSTIGGTLFTDCIYTFMQSNVEEKESIMILDPHTFYPFDSSGQPSRTKGKSYARHVWGSTHDLYGKL